MEQHGLEIFHVKRIPTHGGSIRVYAARKGDYAIQPSVKEIEDAEKNFGLQDKALTEFKRRVVNSKLALMSLLHELKKDGARIVAVGAPSRASTLVNYVGLDEGVIDAVLEIKNSYKIGKYMPGTLIPVRDENLLFEEQPDYALLLSWHIAGELIANLKAKGYKGKFIVPLPEPKIVSSEKEIL